MDSSLVEAGKDLYGTPWQTFRHVTFPATFQGVVAGAVLVFLPASGDFANAEFLGSPATSMIGNVINGTFNQGGYVPLGGTLTVCFMLGIAIVHGLLPALGRTRLARGGDVSAAADAPPRRRRRGFDRPRFLWGLYVAMCLYLFVPILVVIIYSFNSANSLQVFDGLQLPLVPRVLERPGDQELARRELRDRGRDDGRRDGPRDAARVRARACARPHRRLRQHPHAAAADHARDRHGRRPAAALRPGPDGALDADGHPRPHHVLHLVRHRDRARAPLAAQPRGRGGGDGSRRDRARRAAARHAAGAVSGDRWPRRCSCSCSPSTTS